MTADLVLPANAVKVVKAEKDVLLVGAMGADAMVVLVGATEVDATAVQEADQPVIVLKSQPAP